MPTRVLKMIKDYFPSFQERKRLRQLAARKNEERMTMLCHYRDLYSPHLDPHKRILSLEWDALVKGLRKGDLSAVSVLEAYIGKAVESTSQCNSVTEFNPHAATYARELDEANAAPEGTIARLRRATMGKINRPLHGIPFCVNEDMSVKGMDRTLGSAKKLYRESRGDSVTVRILQELGAIPFCKTNTSQTVLNYGSDSPVWGRTLNPFNARLSPGGSNCGAGSLVASNGCMFGAGTDVGGTLRIPAHFNGVSAIMPTNGRLSFRGIESSLPELQRTNKGPKTEHLPSLKISQVPGLIARNSFIISAVFPLLLKDNRQYHFDPYAATVPWNSKAFNSKEKLRIGYFSSVDFFPPLGDTVETVEAAKAALEEMGHELVPFKPPDAYSLMSTAATFLFADNCKSIKHLWKYERVADSSSIVWLTSKVPLVIQKQVRKKLLERSAKFRRSRVFIGFGAGSANDMMEALGDKHDLCNKLGNEWRSKGLDALICPVFPFPAPPRDNPPFCHVAIVYTLIWSLANYPAGVVRFGTESGKHIDMYDDQGDYALMMAKKGIRESIGCPIGVQVVGSPFKEEIILRIMNDLERFKK